MMQRFILASFLLWALVACSTVVPSGPPAATPVKTLSNVVATATKDQGDVSDTQEVPMQEWRGIPILPGAMAGAPASQDNIFTFRVNSTPTEVQGFYRERLTELGWNQPFDDPFDENGGTLTFRKETSSLSITVTPENGSVTVVLTMTLA